MQMTGRSIGSRQLKRDSNRVFPPPQKATGPGSFGARLFFVGSKIVYGLPSHQAGLTVMVGGKGVPMGPPGIEGMFGAMVG